VALLRANDASMNARAAGSDAAGRWMSTPAGRAARYARSAAWSACAWVSRTVSGCRPSASPASSEQRSSGRWKNVLSFDRE
jgi:hypothetical protein